MSNSLEVLGLTLENLKAIAEVRGIKDYECMSKDKLLGLITPSKKQKKQKRRKNVKKQKQVFLKQK